MRRAIYVNLDGLRRDMISPATTPCLAAFAARSTSFQAYRSVFPSATRVVSATFATGCMPARHGLQGNTMAILAEGRIGVHDAGHPEFLQEKRRITGRSLAMPTLAERLSGRGGVIVMNNVSPGAAYAHDPDGFGHVYHRAGSFGPGRKPVAAGEELKITLDPQGDRAMTERFCDEVVCGRRPALGVLWTGEPDHAQHTMALGSPEMLAVLREADANAGRVIAGVDRMRSMGEEILLAIGSDHGHETVSGIIDVDGELVAAGLKEGAGSSDVVSVSNGTSALIYVHPDQRGRIGEIERHLEHCKWAGQVIGPDRLASIGQSPVNGLAIAVSMAADDQANEFGVRGRSLVAKPQFGKPDRLGFGQHGGLARHEQMPFLMIDGPGFVTGEGDAQAASPVDLAPTILKHLGRAAEGLDGRTLQEGA